MIVGILCYAAENTAEIASLVDYEWVSPDSAAVTAT
jgi:hypothetical protein